uniref:Uncharacterized protein n=1 Tax=Macaca nemestrina TaxID=9545 RepID=A0A2K6AWM5_MACNE
MFAQRKWAKYAEIQKLQPPSCFRYLLGNLLVCMEKVIQQISRPQTRGLSPTFSCHLPFPDKLA